MNKPSALLALHRNSIRRIVAAHCGTNARVFGSAAHGADGSKSDLDILVDPLPGARLLDLGAMQFELARRIGVPVDLVTSSDLPAQVREAVLAGARAV